MKYMSLSFLILTACSSRGITSMVSDASSSEASTLLAVGNTSKALKPSVCPDDMVEVDGQYCPEKEEICLYNVDKYGNRLPGAGTTDTSCGEFKNPTRCLSEKIHLHFCIDRYEFPNKRGEKPRDWMTWLDAKKEAEALNKRLCTNKEWTLAAEGPNGHPLPYGDGYHRDNTACNFDRKEGVNVFESKRPDDKTSDELRSLLVTSGSMPNCVSDYGVHDMAGNIDEWVVSEGGTTCMNKSTGHCISGLKGGHIWHVRNASRPITTAHGETFGWYETGARFCKSIP